jgi:hypothetical protein
MIGPVRHHLSKRAEVKAHVRESIEQYRKFDNRPGDRDSQSDRLDLVTDEHRTQVLMSRGMFGQEVVERVQDKAGNITFREYQIGMFSTTQGFEVARSAQGSYEGSLLTFVPGWESSGFHSYDRMSGDQAAQQFNLLEARFSAEFSGQRR